MTYMSSNSTTTTTPAKVTKALADTGWSLEDIVYHQLTEIEFQLEDIGEDVLVQMPNDIVATHGHDFYLTYNAARKLALALAD